MGYHLVWNTQCSKLDHNGAETVTAITTCEVKFSEYLNSDIINLEVIIDLSFFLVWFFIIQICFCFCLNFGILYFLAFLLFYSVIDFNSVFILYFEKMHILFWRFTAFLLVRY